MKYIIPLSLIFLTACSTPEAEKLDFKINNISDSNVVIDCKGKKYNNGILSELRIRSSPNKRPKNIEIKNCLFGPSTLRIIGQGTTGESKDVYESAIKRNHTKRSQDYAPTDILIYNNKFNSIHRTPIYISPGVTNVTIENNIFDGKYPSTVIYMDAESGYNTIKGNIFNAIPISNKREIIAIDGSADNKIINNTFNIISHGAIKMYRNCGEDGVPRHQTPNNNLIKNNTFNLTDLSWGNYAIWVGSRNGNRNYCNDDAKYKFGSGLNDGDFANDNTIIDNQYFGSDEFIRNDGENNIIRNNTKLEKWPFLK